MRRASCRPEGPPVVPRREDARAVERRLLPSGITLVGRDDVENDLVAVKLHVRMGSAEEADELAGAASLVMRLLLKGTARRTAARLAADLESLGGRLTTGSAKEAATVSLLCAREVLAPCLDLLLDAVTEPTFPEGEFETERQAALARIRARKDQLLGLAFDLFHELFYGGHPYHKPAAGYEASVKALKRRDIVTAYERLVTTPNMVAAVVGCVDLDRIAAHLDQGLAALDRGAPPVPAPAPLPARGAESVEERDVQTAKIVAGYPAPPAGHPDAAAMAVFSAVLGGSMDSRLFTELRDKRALAYEVGALYASYIGPSFIAAYMGTRGDQAPGARAALLAEVERLRDEGPTPDEFERARNFLSGSQLMALERNANRAAAYGLNELLGLGYDYGDRFLAALDRVTPGTVRQAAGTWLDRPSITTVLPAGRAVARDGD
jgi:predicted Zn-dependent peptidase